MAVYTDVAAEELAEFLESYDIGELLSYKGIAEGVENSNFLLHTSRGAYILTLYEKRVAEDDLPYFLSLMAHLAERGVSCPQPARNREGKVFSRLAGRPAAICAATSRSAAAKELPAGRAGDRHWTRAGIISPSSPARVRKRSVQVVERNVPLPLAVSQISPERK